MGQEWAHATLRITSEKNSAEDISRILSTQPSSAHDKGELVYSRNPNFKYDKAIWMLKSSLPETTDIVLQIEEHFAFLESRNAHASLRNEFEMDIFCGYSSNNGQGGFVLPPDLINRAAKLGLGFTLDLYTSTQDKE